MKHKKLSDALSELQNHHIDEAIHYKKRKSVRWIGPIAAVLALAVLVGVLWRPGSTIPGTPSGTIPGLQEVDPPKPSVNPGVHLQHVVVKAEYPMMAHHPELSQDGDYATWQSDQLAMHTQPEGYADSLQNFWLKLNQAVLESNEGGNVTCSPVNIYMALSMLAETTGGESQQQILDALGVDSIEDIRTQANQVWQGHYNNDGLSTSVLANSLWLQENYGFNMDTADLLAKKYYASVFQGNLGSKEMTDALKDWLSEQTGGMLDEQIDGISLHPRTVLALASTIYYKVQWANRFIEELNTESKFHGTKGETAETFMNKSIMSGSYFWSDHFGATFLSLQDGSRMWLFLPDEGVAPEDIVKEAHAFLQSNPDRSTNQKLLQINLSLPKFDICADLDLQDPLKQMGITDVFDSTKADFTPLLSRDDDGFISDAKHAARVAIDEKGVTAAAYTLFLRDATSMPPSGDEIDFVLDRPFLFYVESEDGLPLFTGIVNEP